MTTITRERLLKIQQWRETYGPGSNVVLPAEEAEGLARIALASLEAEPVLYAAEETLAYAKHGELHLTCLSEPMGDAVIPLYATLPAQRMPDMNGFRPCPFCNSPVKWCGENSADPEDDHACHHIQCTNPECGADFDFTNTGDDLLPDDPAILDAMTAAECLQPLRNVCLNRFNSRAAMLHGSQAVSNRDELLPSIKHAPELDSVAKNAKLLPSKYPVIPDEVLSAIRKVARIRTDLNDFDGDRRGIADCLDEAEQELIVTINEHAAMLQAGNGSTNGKPLTITLPALPVLGTQEEWYQGFAAGAGSMREECAAALISAGIRVEMK
ncbi:TPA: hypothetical protein I8190_000866 [Citrobacter freundii]|uniref:hypothetical protein n=1 Tax=Citrobacter farmeri TaxID=67824 RepID=UPI001A2E50DF|nr:hypothetical protein [Citrobacter farmeri]HAT2284170.1 hypothetical protein [Citrobacter freundii]HAT2348163.1 hypothetical protein [Citrobacter freundii]HAT2429753.1 hypothetical protein [Citrobacter freundii]HAT2501319.1 hypothetical protein [Citrobacter freundii]